ncbi:uncharacterized protein A4U43_UnF5720 [Asparagus officinalis]|uniref:Pectinesterase catalytic domain-containing protein n=1 Tax=Asparagus officinalis TaxID=4686 RepID=A0A1R3L6M6_ASPOF|nr:uncharacterized protein A4U43_UnF5720 [Asparagus officinalis]
MGKTVITGNLNAGMVGVSTYNTATVGVLGDGFIATNLTISNTAGRVRRVHRPPRHPLPQLPPPALQILRHIRHGRLHLRRLGLILPGLPHPHRPPPAQPRSGGDEHRHGPRTNGPRAVNRVRAL